MKKNKKLLFLLIGLVILMFAFSFALVPLYNVMCKVFGITGKTNTETVLNKTVVDRSRTITIQFVASPNPKLNWDFYPEIKTLDVHPGQTEKMFYIAKNNADHPITAQAVPSVSPGIAGQYFKKIECFCFRQQTLQAHQQIKMPVIFYIDPKLSNKIHELTISYALYPVSS